MRWYDVLHGILYFHFHFSFRNKKKKKKTFPLFFANFSILYVDLPKFNLGGEEANRNPESGWSFKGWKVKFTTEKKNLFKKVKELGKFFSGLK